MRKTILMMLLAVVSTSTLAAWVKVGEIGTTTDYADPTTIRKEGDNVKMWALRDHKTKVLVENGKPFKSTKEQSEYDCKEKQLRMLSMSFYSRNKARGEIVHRESDPGNWEPVEVGSTAEALWKIACGKK